MKKAISFDIDGIINNYPLCFLDFYALRFGKEYQTLEDLKQEIGETSYSDAKREYRLSDFKYSVPIDDRIKGLMQTLNGCCDLYILSSRPFDEFPGMFERTVEWLRLGNVPFLKILPKCRASLHDLQICLHVDDEVSHVLQLLNSTSTNFVLLGDGPSTSRLTFCADKSRIVDHVLRVMI